MIENILWLALGLLIIASIIPRNYRLKFTVAGAGWAFFAVHWAFQWQHYAEVEDYVNVALTILTAVICVFIGYILIRQDKRILRDTNGVSTTTSLFMATTAAAIGGISYFTFSDPDDEHMDNLDCGWPDNPGCLAFRDRHDKG